MQCDVLTAYFKAEVYPVKRERPRVLVDVDGVLADYVAAVLLIVNNLTGRTYTTTSEWDIAQAFGLTKDQEEELYRCTREAGFCASIPVINGAVDGVNSLREIADVYFITSPTHGRHWYYERAEWLVRHFDAHIDHIGQIKRKEIVAGDVLLDDKPENVREWSRHHPDGVGVLWAQPYNSGEGDLMRRTGSWEDVRDLVQERFGSQRFHRGSPL